jgi:phosphonate degradation associated HDIG domain protein
MTLVDEISGLFDRRGAAAYFGESVSMKEHSLQAAYFAHRDAAPPALVIAALLHDVGHLLDDVPEDIREWTTDARHEEAGSRWLAHRFPLSISEPVRLHVPAKRYLCATDSAYYAKLSSASVITLKLQGGPMSPNETAKFEAEPFHREAVRVRRWDDAGKMAGLIIPELADYVALIKYHSLGTNIASRT